MKLTRVQTERIESKVSSIKAEKQKQMRDKYEPHKNPVLFARYMAENYSPVDLRDLIISKTLKANMSDYSFMPGFTWEEFFHVADMEDAKVKLTPIFNMDNYKMLHGIVENIARETLDRIFIEGADPVKEIASMENRYKEID